MSEDGISVYLLKDRYSYNRLIPVEWVSASTMWGDNNIFVSRVYDNTQSDTQRGIDKIRAEELHFHKNKNNPNLTIPELYLVTNGRGALYTGQNNKKQIRILNAGDFCLVTSGIEHCLCAIDGEYEHLVAQIPSTHQYEPLFKNSISLVPEKLILEAKEKLKTT